MKINRFNAVRNILIIYYIGSDMTTFDEFLDLSASEDFLVTEETDFKAGRYVFETKEGLKMEIKRLITSLSDTIPAWSITINGDRVQFDNPAQLITVNTVVTGLCSRCLQKGLSEPKG